MVLLPPQPQNANPCLQGSRSFASSIEKVESSVVKEEASHAQTPQTLYAGIPG